MQVAIDISQSVYGSGVSDYVINLTKNLSSDLVKPFGYAWGNYSLLKNLFPDSEIKKFPPSVVESLWNNLHLLNYENIFSSADIVHSSDWIEPPTKLTKVTTIHDLAPFLYPNETSSSIVQVHTRKMRWAVKECKKFICVSKSTANDFMKYFSVSSSRVEVIHEALPSRFADISLPKSVSHTENNYLLSMGSSQPRKNILLLMETYRKYKHQFKLPDKLIIVGENNISTQDEDIEFTGYIDNIKLVTLMTNASAFVYPSIYEGFGLPALLAFHCHTPLVVSNTSSLPEVVESAGILVDPNSARDLAQGIKQALTGRTDLIAAGVNQLKKFSWEKTAAETSKFYESL